MKPGRDASGAAIALFTANLHNPKAVTHRTTLQGIIYQLDAALLSIETQKAGLVFIYDMSASKYSNFDYELSQRILNLLKVSFLFRTFFLFYINSFSIWKSLSTSHKIGDFRFVKFGLSNDVNFSIAIIVVNATVFVSKKHIFSMKLFPSQEVFFRMAWICSC